MNDTTAITLRLPKAIIVALDERVFAIRKNEKSIRGMSRTRVILDTLSRSLNLHPVAK